MAPISPEMTSPRWIVPSWSICTARWGILPRLVAGQAREAVSLMLLRADLANVKIILRGREAGWTKEEILGRLEAGTIPRALYGVLAEAADAAALAQLLALPGHPLARALRLPCPPLGTRWTWR